MCQHERTIATSQRLRGHTPGHEFNKLLVYVHSTDATLPKSGDDVPPNHERAQSQCHGNIKAGLLE